MRSAIIFIEASLELVPKHIARHPAVVADARRRKKKPTEILLDDSKHHAAMKNLKDRHKRGRPDIVHQCLLLVLDSPFSSDFDIYVHTIGGEIIWVNSKTRLPRNYNRFVGLIEDLFRKRRIESDGEILLEITDLKLEDIVKGKRVVLLSEDGERGCEALVEAFKDRFAICIGAFPHGEFSSEVLQVLRDAEIVSFGRQPYTSLYVTSKVLCIYERVRTAEGCS